MSEEIVGVKIQVDATDMNKSVGDLRKKITETEAEVKRLEDAYGKQSKEAIEGQKRLTQLQDITNKKIEQQNERLDNAAKTISALSAAYGGVQGALELTGLAGEDTIKQLAKIQSALAIGDAIQNLTEFRGAITKTFSSFGSSIKSTFSTLKSSLIATGIGAFVVALGLVAANFETVKKVVLNLIPGLGKVADFIGNLVNKVTDFVGITSEAGRATAKLIADNEKAIKDGERFLDLNADKYDEYTQRKIKANIEFKKKQNEFQNDEKLTEEQKNAFIVQAREKANREIAKSDSDRNKAFADANKKLSEEQKAINEKIEADRKARKEQQYNDFVQFVNDFKSSTDAEVELQEFLISEQKRKEQELFDWRVDLAQQKYDESEAEFAFLQELNKKTLAENQKFADEELKAKENLENAKFEAAVAGINLLMSLAGENEKVANALFIVDKALAIARIVVDTQKEIAGYASNPLWSALPDGGLLIKSKYSLAAKLRAGASIATIAATTIGKFKNGSAPAQPGGIVGGSAPIAPVSPQAQLTQLNQASINQMGSAAGRAYVVESDITNQQEKIVRINRAARLS
jgi:hypothetical protein